MSDSQRDDGTRFQHPLKELVSLIVNRGRTYEQIASDSTLVRDWDKDTLKQFVHRKSNFRHSNRIVRLAAYVTEYFEEEIRNGNVSPNIASLVGVVSNEFGIDEKSIFEEAKKDFRNMQKSSMNIHFPEKILFVRFNADHSKLIKIVIEVHNESESLAFSMKIVGDSHLKRFVYGTISSTAVNYYFSGLAYNVTTSISNEQFSEIDLSNINVRRKILSDNPVGLEYIAVSNDHLYDSQFPVSFVGLSARNTPICGVGLFINRFVWDEYNFDSDSLISSKCEFDEGPISELIKGYNDNSVIKINESDFIQTSCADFRKIPQSLSSKKNM